MISVSKRTRPSANLKVDSKPYHQSLGRQPIEPIQRTPSHTQHRPHATLRAPVGKPDRRWRCLVADHRQHHVQVRRREFRLVAGILPHPLDHVEVQHLTITCNPKSPKDKSTTRQCMSVLANVGHTPPCNIALEFEGRLSRGSPARCRRAPCTGRSSPPEGQRMRTVGRQDEPQRRANARQLAELKSKHVFDRHRAKSSRLSGFHRVPTARAKSDIDMAARGPG